MSERKFSKDFEELKTGIKNILDFNTFQYSNNYLGRRFDSRLRVYKLDTYHAYWELLKNDEKEQEILRKELTINVTEFFRDNSMYSMYMNEVFTNMLQWKKNGKIRIWSAGSSDGKEAYSLAMIAVEKLGEIKAKSRFEIIGTDIDKACLQRATSGIYEYKPGMQQSDIKKQLSFIKNPEQYFDINDNIYSAKPCIKNLVRFEYHDLISGLKKSNFDIILCRNVVIYFNKELKEVLYMNYYNALNEGGYFIMGKTESMQGDARDRFKQYNSKERIYIKNESE